MNAISSSDQASRRRGRKRRGTPEAPCADCIHRASQSSGKGDVSFCDDCARALGHTRRLQPEPHIKLQTTSGNSRITKKADYHRRATANSIRAALNKASDHSPGSTLVSRVAGTARTTTAASTPTARQPSRVPRDKLAALPTIFDSLKHAADMLQPIEGRLSSLILDIESHDQATVLPFSQDTYREKCRVWLIQWERAFAGYLSQSRSLMTNEQLKAAWTLKAHHLIAESFAAVHLTEAQLDWSVFTADFLAVLRLAAEVIKDTPRTQASSLHSSRANSLDKYQSALPELSILDPVYEVQLRTTSHDLRNEAQRLLKTIDPIRFGPGIQEIMAASVRSDSAEATSFPQYDGPAP